MNDVAKQRFEELRTGGLLPSPRGVALSIVEVTANPDATIDGVTRLVQVDPAMAGRILRYANAVHGGGLRRIASLAHAITFLGLFRVRQIALAFSLIDHYRTGECPAFGYFGYWTTSLATGIAAQRLAIQAQSPPDESFTCGLLSGVGRLGLATVYPQAYSELIESGAGGMALLDAERARFGIDHAQLSAEMLASWGLPEIFTDAVRHHEHPANAPCSPDTRAYALTASLHFASRIGKLLNLDEAHRWERVPSLFHAAAQLGFEADDVSPLIEAVVADWQAWGKELKLPTKSHFDLRAMLAAPQAAAEDEGTALGIAPLQVGLIMAASDRQAALARTLSMLGLRVGFTGDPAEAGAGLAGKRQDVLIVDLGEADPEAMERLRALHAEAGAAGHVIALISPAAESQVAELLLAGAADYLTYDHTEGALIARLANAQQMVSLRGAVRTEWQLAISSSGSWARANRRLLREALTDPLTQLPNRRYGLDRFSQEWAVAASNVLPVVCMMLDIDHFKRVNDQRGHDVGDLVLQQVASAIERSCRRSDILFRYGGEEFCCISPHTGLDDAIQLAERIAGAVARGSYGLPDDRFAVTVSVGVAAKTEEMRDPADLIAKADRALYAAKEQGRNRVVALSG
jgi:diguanylate cyclase (GGDEF)-like protein